MKELTPEEKAKAYDEALSWMSDLYPTLEGSMKEDAEHSFPELKESEDEKMRRKTLKVLNYYKDEEKSEGRMPTEIEECIAWLEKQGEHADFRNKIQIGDKVTRNKDGVLVNLSQLKRVANKDENQGEQKSTWSEEDEDRFNTIINHFIIDLECTEDDDLIVWLKSLKDRDTWKTNKEHIHSLEYIINSLDSMFHAIGHIDNTTKPRLQEILENLKKLTEE